MIISRREYFEICPDATEEMYQKCLEELAEAEEKMWEEDHPLDD